MNKPATARVTTDAPGTTLAPTAKRFGKRRVADARGKWVHLRS